MGDVTRILTAIEQGERHAADDLLPIVYDELRKLASHRMAREQPDHTLQPTALVHEVYLRLFDGQKREFKNRKHLFAASAEAMRRILIERARRVRALKRGGDRQRVPANDAVLAVEDLTRDEGAFSLGRAARDHTFYDLMWCLPSIGRMNTKTPPKVLHSLIFLGMCAVADNTDDLITDPD